MLFWLCLLNNESIISKILYVISYYLLWNISAEYIGSKKKLKWGKNYENTHRNSVSDHTYFSHVLLVCSPTLKPSSVYLFYNVY